MQGRGSAGGLVPGTGEVGVMDTGLAVAPVVPVAATLAPTKVPNAPEAIILVVKHIASLAGENPTVPSSKPARARIMVLGEVYRAVPIG